MLDAVAARSGAASTFGAMQIALPLEIYGRENI
jgi:hypothetical protein